MTILYDSFLDPLIILFALPVAVGGAIAALWVFGDSFSIFALIGLILLVGLAIKNGILLVDRTNRNRAAGMPVRAALLEAGPARLRPILMTSLTIAVALAPSAFRLGEGADLRAPLAAARPTHRSLIGLFRPWPHTKCFLDADTPPSPALRAVYQSTPEGEAIR